MLDHVHHYMFDEKFGCYVKWNFPALPDFKAFIENHNFCVIAYVENSPVYTR